MLGLPVIADDDAFDHRRGGQQDRLSGFAQPAELSERPGGRSLPPKGKGHGGEQVFQQVFHGSALFVLDRKVLDIDAVGDVERIGPRYAQVAVRLPQSIAVDAGIPRRDDVGRRADAHPHLRLAEHLGGRTKR